MSRKRQNTSSPESESPPPKRSRQVIESDDDSEQDDNVPKGHEKSRVDASTGQKGAFPGLDDDTDELFYGPASDGIEYLRMVR